MTDNNDNELTGNPNDVQIGGGHYKGSTYQHWDWACDVGLGFLEGNASKYLARWDSKGTPEQDLKKARHYIQKIAYMHRTAGYQGPSASDELCLLRFFSESGITVESAALCWKVSTWRTHCDLKVILSGINDLLDSLVSLTVPAPPLTEPAPDFREFEV